MALEFILRLDLAQEQRELSPEERDLRKRLKRRIISLAVLKKSRKRQNSRITNLKGDANTRYFHLRVNHQRRKNLIHRLKHNNGWVMNHEQKEKIIHDHFTEAIGRGGPRTKDFNWQNLEFEEIDLHGLDDPFTTEEVWNAIKQMPSDTAPARMVSRMSFTRLFTMCSRRTYSSFLNSYTTTRWISLASIKLTFLSYPRRKHP